MNMSISDILYQDEKGVFLFEGEITDIYEEYALIQRFNSYSELYSVLEAYDPDEYPTEMTAFDNTDTTASLHDIESCEIMQSRTLDEVDNYDRRKSVYIPKSTMNK